MTQKLKIIPLGGLLEIGKNMTVIEYGSDMIIIDVGVAFPDDDMMGVDLVIPDFSYVVQNKKKVKGIFLTHGHEDHIGGVPFLLETIGAPIYSTRFTQALVERKLLESKPAKPYELHQVEPGSVVEAGCFKVEFIHVNHSIADAAALAIGTPLGTLVHTGDFKIDTTPVAGDMFDLTRFGILGRKGVLLLMSDSTNAERPGMSMSEKTVGERFRQLFKDNTRRIIVASFSSNVHRMQQVIDAAMESGRKIAVSGRSMENVMSIGRELGYINIPEEALIDITEVKNFPRKKVCIMTTGSQGEEMSALYRMAFDTHKQVKITDGDLVIISANPIPGNEKPVFKLVNELFRKGAEVVYERFAEVHVSGHACREELKTILQLTHPRYFMPVHGEFRHLASHASLAEAVGIPKQNIFISENGRILEIGKETAKLSGTVTSGKVFVDGLGVGDVESVVLRDRKLLASDGVMTISFAIDLECGELLSGPDIQTKGFIYAAKEAETLMTKIRSIATATLKSCLRDESTGTIEMKVEIRDAVLAYVRKQIHRSPIVLVTIHDISE